MVYIMLADGFEIVEALAPADILKRAGAKVVTVGVTGKTVAASCGIKVEADITKDQLVLLDDIELLMLPGGMPGTNNLDADSTVHKAIEYCVSKGKLVAAICAAPKVLGRMGLLKGRKATCFPGFENDLIGAELTGLKAVRDGQFITGKGAGAALEFGFALTEALYGKAKADEVAVKMMYK